MKDGVKELAAIVVDWCEADLMGDGFAGAGATGAGNDQVGGPCFGQGVGTAGFAEVAIQGETPGVADGGWSRNLDAAVPDTGTPCG